MAKLRVVDGGLDPQPSHPVRRPRPRLSARGALTGLRPLIFSALFTAAAIIFDAYPVLVSETASGIMPIACIFAAWFTSVALGRASWIFGGLTLVVCGGGLLYVPQATYAPVTDIMLQGHVVAVMIGLILRAFASGKPNSERWRPASVIHRPTLRCMVSPLTTCSGRCHFS